MDDGVIDALDELELAEAISKLERWKNSLKPGLSDAITLTLDALKKTRTQNAEMKTALKFIVNHPSGVGSHKPFVIARKALEACGSSSSSV